MIRRPVGSMTRKRLPGVRRGGEALPTSKRQESRARLNPSRPLPSPILFALTALARFLSLLLLARHLHSAWRLPPPERHLHRGYDDGHLLLDRRTTTTASSTGCTSHHPHRKIIICHIHQYTILSIPPSLPFPPLRFFSLSPRFFVPKGLVTNSPLSLSLFFSSFLPRVLRVHPSIPFIYSSPCIRLCILISLFRTNMGGFALVRFADASFSGVVLYCTLCLLLFLC